MNFFAIIILGWLIPGGGYFILNKPIKFLVLASTVIVTFFIGCILCDFQTVTYEDNPFYFFSKYCSGLIFLLQSTFMGPEPKNVINQKYWESGYLYVAIAGYINILFIINEIYFTFNLDSHKEKA